MDNTIYLPQVDSTRVLNTGDGDEMARADSVLHGSLLTITSLPTILAQHGKQMVVASSGSSGSAFLLAGAGRAPVLHTTMVMPTTLRPMVERVLGPHDDMEGAPNLRANARAVDALLRIGIDSLNPHVAMLWLSDPDHTAHGAGLGSVLADSAIRAVDREVQRVLNGLDARGLRDQVTIFVVSDHGFSTQAGRNAPIRSVLAPFKSDVVEAGGAVYLRPGATISVHDVVRALQASPAVGAIFTRGADSTTLTGNVPGTLSFTAAGWSHARSGDVMFSANWTHERNAAGYIGWTALAGTAGHGTTSPHDISATFVAAGPRVRRGQRSLVPSANSDLAPTILALLGLPPARSMSGRPLRELFSDGPTLRAVRISRQTVSASVPGATATASGYHTTLFTSHVDGRRYIDSTRTVRAPVVPGGTRAR